MRPGMACNLMSTAVHALNQGRPRHPGAVDLALGVVVSRNKKGHFSLVFIEKVKKVLRVLLGAIVESQGNGPRDGTRPNEAWAIGDVASQRPRDLVSRRTSWGYVSVAMTIIDLTVGRAAVVLRVSAIT